jgi:hypothetical protein
MLKSFQCQPPPTFCFVGRIPVGLAGLGRNLIAGASLRSLRPAFTSERYGDPGYAQLSQGCAREILIGAEDGAEMGVFNMLQQPQREATLCAVLDEYIPFGLIAGIFYVT